MPKGFYTQCVAVLFERAPKLDELAASLVGTPVVRRTEPGKNIWMGGPGLVLAMRPEVNGYVQVDLVDRRWPDHLGDPKGEAELFGAWSMGFFGPFTFPEGLSRAQQMSFSWPEVPAVVSKHTSFVRVKSTYVLGAADDAPLLPADYAALPELELVTDVARALLEVDGAVAYFNPGGEVLRSLPQLDDDIRFHRQQGLPNLPSWSNVRLFRLTPSWTMMDTIGMEQLDVDDHEACFETRKYSPQEVDRFLRNATDYVRSKGPIIADRDTMTGPGGIAWQAHSVEKSLAPRPRSVLRWLPLDGAEVPPMLGG
jgi:hypothetical protein